MTLTTLTGFAHWNLVDRILIITSVMYSTYLLICSDKENFHFFPIFRCVFSNFDEQFYIDIFKFTTKIFGAMNCHHGLVDADEKSDRLWLFNGIIYRICMKIHTCLLEF